MRFRRRRDFARALTGSVLAAQLLGCFSERSEPAGPGGGDDCRVPANVLGSRKAVVTVYKYAFYPDTLHISAGTTVTWVNCDVSAGSDAHTSTSDTGVWSSALFAEGQLFAREFSQSGSFPYHCEPHPAMRAVVIVQ